MPQIDFGTFSEMLGVTRPENADLLSSLSYEIVELGGLIAPKGSDLAQMFEQFCTDGRCVVADKALGFVFAVRRPSNMKLTLYRYRLAMRQPDCLPRGTGECEWASLWLKTGLGYFLTSITPSPSIS